MRRDRCGEVRSAIEIRIAASRTASGTGSVLDRATVGVRGVRPCADAPKISRICAVLPAACCTSCTAVRADPNDGNAERKPCHAATARARVRSVQLNISYILPVVFIYIHSIRLYRTGTARDSEYLRGGKGFISLNTYIVILVQFLGNTTYSNR
jgi:hypothetical protein